MRIVSLAPSNTEILFALGAGEEVVAVTHFCDYPKAAGAKQKIGAWINTEPEKIAALRPDLILTSYFIPEPLRNWNGPGALLHVAPTTLAGVFESIRGIGAAVGRSSAADTLVRTMEESFARISALAPRQPRRLYLEEWPEPPMASGNWVPELIRIAGGEQGIAEIGKPSVAFAFERLMAWNPDMIVCHWCGFGERADPARVATRPGWEGLRAVHEGRIHFLNDSLINRPGPRLVEGAMAMQNILRGV
jgi:iron complex transport system substrate-binding protein